MALGATLSNRETGNGDLHDPMVRPLGAQTGTHRTNGFVERVNRNLLDECFRVKGRETFYLTIQGRRIPKS